ncbi:MAG TPA: biopolymer transporter ExbD [Bryobacteraceae bacterium]|nr:biopolymer transporter ExbD [Bryobacteraceae bacterium]
MAFSSGGDNAGRGRPRGGGALAEMNVVPLVDVVLVLLVIFMLTANVMEFGLEVDVPKVKTVQQTADVLPIVTVTSDAELSLGDKPVNINSLASQVRERYTNAKAVYVRADKGTTWEVLAQVVAALADAKLDVRMVTQPEDETGRRRRR